MKARNPSTGNLETVYVKALDSMPVGTEVDFDGDSADIPDGWELVGNNYSTSEIKTGKTWIDGKPIYRKVFIINKNQTSSSSINIEHNISNIDTLITQTGSLKRTDNIWFSIPNGLTTNTDYETHFADFDSTYLRVRMGASVYSLLDKVIAVLEYTKTTD